MCGPSFRLACSIAVGLAVALAVWADGEPVVIVAHKAPVNALVFTPDGGRFISGSFDGTVAVGTDGGVERRIVAHKDNAVPKSELPGGVTTTGGVLALLLAKDGSLLVSAGSDGRVRLWDVATGDERHTFDGHTAMATALALAPDGKTLASSDYNGTVRLWDIDRKKEIRVIGASPMRLSAVVFSADGKTLYTGGVRANKRLPNAPMLESAQVQSYDVATGDAGPLLDVKAHHLFPAPGGKGFLAAGVVAYYDRSPGTYGPYQIDDLIIGADDVLQLWDGRPRRRWTLQAQGVLAAFSADGKRLAVAPGASTFLELGADGGNFLSGNGGETRVCVFDTASRELLEIVPVKDATALAFAPDGKRLAVGTLAGKVVLHTLSDKKPVAIAPEQHWQRLAEVPWEVCYRSVWTLAGGGDQTVAFLAKKLNQPPDFSAAQVQRWIADLGDEEFLVRDAAHRDLQRVGILAVPLMKKALANSPVLETRRRIEFLLKRYENQADGRPAPDIRRALRAVTILEDVGTPAARRLLEKVAAGDAILPATDAARAALKRWEKRAP